jgi:hypothetical protein
LAVPAIFFPLHAVAQSGANAVDVRTRAYTADSQVGGRKPIAIIAGRAIYEDELLSLMEQQLQRLRNEEYELKSQALETLINQKLLEAAASRKGITADKLIEREVSSKIPNPSDTEIEGFLFRAAGIPAAGRSEAAPAGNAEAGKAGSRA